MKNAVGKASSGKWNAAVLCVVGVFIVVIGWSVGAARNEPDARFVELASLAEETREHIEQQDLSWVWNRLSPDSREQLQDSHDRLQASLILQASLAGEHASTGRHLVRIAAEAHGTTAAHVRELSAEQLWVSRLLKQLGGSDDVKLKFSRLRVSEIRIGENVAQVSCSLADGTIQDLQFTLVDGAWKFVDFRPYFSLKSWRDIRALSLTTARAPEDR